MSIDLKRTKKGEDRIFDRFVDRTFKTVDGQTAIFSPTKGGSNTNWQNHVLVVGLEVTYADGRTESYDVSAGIIQEVSTQRNSGTANIKVSSLNKALVDMNAEKVKDGDQFYENRKLSFVLNTILNEVFKDGQNNLPDDKRVSADLLTVKTSDNKLGYWSLGTYPGFDGSSFTPSPNAIPMTALATNEDRSIIYVATGGVSASATLVTASAQANPPELWQYSIDEDQWTFLASTTSGNEASYAPIQKLFYNSYDGYLYGVIYKDYGDVESDVEDKANKINWICPEGGVFKWLPTGDSGYLNDGNHYTGLGNLWPGTWDFRMMYPDDDNVHAGPLRSGSAQATGGDDYAKQSNGETHKVTKGRAGVGNFTAYRYMSLPLGPAGQQGYANTHEARRATHWLHPQVSGYKDTQRPATDLFGATTELTPTTLQNGNTYWNNASGSTPPTGWTKKGSASMTLSGDKKLTIATSSDDDAIQFLINDPVDNMTVYKLGLKGTNFRIHVDNQTTGTPTNSLVYGPYGMSNSHAYTSTHLGNGDYYFSVLKTNAIPNLPEPDQLRIYLTAKDHASDVVMENISLAVAHHWDHWHNLSRMAGENIPLTHYSKVIAGTTIRRPTHQYKSQPAGPQAGGSARKWNSHAGPWQWFYDMYDDSGQSRRDFIQDTYQGETQELNSSLSATDIKDRQPSPYEITHPMSDTDAFGSDALGWAGQSNEEIVMEFNTIAQDRRNLSQVGAGGMHPLYGPNDLEDGIQPDNSYRLQVGSRNIRPTAQITTDNNNGFNNSAYANEARVVNMGPLMDSSSTEPKGFGSSEQFEAGLSALNAGESTLQKGNGGYGYGSVIVQGLGERAHTKSSNREIYGAVRYTNGQKGCIVFNQEADQGKGVIIFQRFAGTAPHDNKSFRWDPDATSGQEGHFAVTWRYYRCTDKAQGGMSSMPPTTSSVSALTPHSYTSVPLYTTAGCSGPTGLIFVALHESRSHSQLFTGSNEGDILNKTMLYRVQLETGSWSSSASSTKLYDSSSDASVYNGQMDGSSDSARFANYAAGNAVNKSRKILELHYNNDLATTANGTNGLIGACFRRDSILAEYGDSTPYTPCHEVFTFAGTSNQLKILDHDIQDGINHDAVGFTGFVNTTGKFGADTLNVGTNKAVFYFRLQKATVAPTVRSLTGRGLKVNYLYSPSSGNFNAGNFFDDKTPATTKFLYQNEGFTAHGLATAGLIDKGTDSEREIILAAFDDYRGWYNTSQRAKKKFAFGSSKYWFKIDDKEVDPRFQLLDFSNLTAFDAISKLAQANNMAFGFDVETFFLVNREQTSTTHTLNAMDGEVIDIKKSLDNDIRNVISIQAFRQQVQDVEWEVTHVGGNDVLANDQLYNGEFTVTAKTHREASVNLICTRQGRLIRSSLDDETAVAQDAITNIGSRFIPLFKWRTHAPTKQVVLMKPMLSTTTVAFVNTTFANGNSPVTKGEIVIFTNQTTYEQIGRVITEVDTTLNRITLEDSVGEAVESGTPLNIVRSHTGAELTENNKTATSSYGTKYSDEGVTVVTEVVNSDADTADNRVHGVCSAGNYSHYGNRSTCSGAGHTWTPTTRLRVNNIRPFANCRIFGYNPETYKHYAFLVTTMSSSQLQDAALPQQNDLAFPTQTTNAATSIYSNNPIAWVKAIDETNGYIYLNGTYPAFKVGDVLNAHYAMAPSQLIIQTEDGAVQPPPYSSVQQDLPEGLGTWSWKCDSSSDLFNLKDIINFKFQGIKLVKDGGSIYTVADAASIAKYGQRTWNFPDNRFITHDRVEYWATKFLNEYGDPKYAIEATVPFDPTLTFTTPAGNLLRRVTLIDEIMFPGIAGFSVSGYLRETSLNVKNTTMNLKFRTEEKY